MDANVVVRMWRGAVRSEDRDAYVDYIEQTGMQEYRKTPGNIDAWMLTRDLPGSITEIVTVSRWQSLEAIKGFAGEDIERAVFYPEDDRYLVERDTTVRHYSQVG
jgi:heme-degrading monooxygenase HmoA